MKLDRRGSLGRLSLLFAGLALFSGGDPLQAKTKKNNNKKRPLTKKGKASELPVVRKVSSSGVTVGDKYYEVGERTEILVDGEEAELSDLKPGMQASVVGGVSSYGETKSDTIYKASRISARKDNQLAKKAAEANRKAAERARQANQRNRKKGNPNRR